MAEASTKGFGDRLRRAREEAGRDVRSVADITRIQSRYLNALEAEDWSVVPKGVIGRGFVRVVARELGVPAAELIQLYRAARGEEDAEPDRSPPEVDWKVDLGVDRKKWPLVIAGVVIVAATVVIWRWTSRGPAGEPATPPQVEAPKVTVVPPPAPAVAEKPPEPQPQGGAAPAEEKAVATSPAAAEPPKAQPASGELLRFEVEARDKVWLKVAADDGAGRERVLKPGERVAYEAKTSFQVKLGNAGSVKLYWNGEALKPAGKTSQVVTLSLPKDLPTLKP